MLHDKHGSTFPHGACVQSSNKAWLAACFCRRSSPFKPLRTRLLSRLHGSCDRCLAECGSKWTVHVVCTCSSSDAHVHVCKLSHCTPFRRPGTTVTPAGSQAESSHGKPWHGRGRAAGRRQGARRGTGPADLPAGSVPRLKQAEAQNSVEPLIHEDRVGHRPNPCRFALGESRKRAPEPQVGLHP